MNRKPKYQIDVEAAKREVKLKEIYEAKDRNTEFYKVAGIAFKTRWNKCIESKWTREAETIEDAVDKHHKNLIKLGKNEWAESLLNGFSGK